MQDNEEEPIAVAFCDGPDSVLHELVFDQDIFWGTIFRNYWPVHPTTTRQLTTRNNHRIEALILVTCPLLPAVLRDYIAQLVHYHY
jgi:hypothetical protein